MDWHVIIVRTTTMHTLRRHSHARFTKLIRNRHRTWCACGSNRGSRRRLRRCCPSTRRRCTRRSIETTGATWTSGTTWRSWFDRLMLWPRVWDGACPTCYLSPTPLTHVRVRVLLLLVVRRRRLVDGGRRVWWQRESARERESVRERERETEIEWNCRVAGTRRKKGSRISNPK